jgi:sulfite exporter TauE/SafE
VTAFLLGVLAASFLGSLHCVGMCGPLVGLCSAQGKGRVLPPVLYQGGRLLTLLVLGALAGLLGTGIDALGEGAGAQRVAAAVAGGMMILWGAVALARGAGWELPLPAGLQELLTRAQVAAARSSGRKQALLLGLITPLLPCGWLYLFVLSAAGTGHPGWGAAALTAFWAGNLPALVALGLGLGALLRRPRARRLLPTISGVTLVALGLLLVIQRSTLELPKPVAATAAPTAEDQAGLPCCDHGQP